MKTGHQNSLCTDIRENPVSEISLMNVGWTLVVFGEYTDIGLRASWKALYVHHHASPSTTAEYGVQRECGGSARVRTYKAEKRRWMNVIEWKYN